MLFSANETNFLFNTIPIDSINSGGISQEELQNRFYADIVKDGQGAGTNLIKTMSKIYTYSGGDWQTTLNALEKKLFEDNPDINLKTTLLKNILKTSTVGSNTKISDAKNVFWESGMGSENIMATKDPTTIQTPAAQLDSLGKEKAKIYWPERDEVTFDSAFLEEIGFPARMSWVYKPGSVTITYSNGVEPLTFAVEPFGTNSISSLIRFSNIP